MSTKKIPAVPVPETPEFTDKAIVQLQQLLKTELPWLRYSFGRAQKLVKKKDKSQYFYPGVHLGDREYLDVFPNDQLGTFSFFIMEDPQEFINYMPHAWNKIKTKFSLIVWVDLDLIFGKQKDRDTEAVKKEILDVLTRRAYLKRGSISISRIYEEAANIYRGYSIREIESQFLMQPFAGFRFEGELILQELC